MQEERSLLLVICVRAAAKMTNGQFQSAYLWGFLAVRPNCLFTQANCDPSPMYDTANRIGDCEAESVAGYRVVVSARMRKQCVTIGGGEKIEKSMWSREILTCADCGAAG